MKHIMIVCQCATNKGDRAIAEYLIEQLLKKDVSITLSATAPELWNNIHRDQVEIIGTGYRALFPKAKSRVIRKVCGEITNWYYNHFVYKELIQNGAKKRCERISGKFISALTSADLVIVTGGHHITSIRNKNALFSITYDIALTSYFSKRYILWSQTIGPLAFDNHAVQTLFSNIIRKAGAVYIRDENSKACLNELLGGEQSNVYKSFDSVFGFGNREYKPISERENKVGISIFNGLKKAFRIYPAIAKVLDYFVLQGNAVEFFRMEQDPKELEDIQAIIRLMKTEADIQIFPFESTTEEHLKELSSCKYFIGYKTHSVIMALTTATPLLGICYHRKTRDFMADYGLEEYALEDECFSSEKGIATAKKIIGNAEHINAVMARKSKQIAFSVEQDFKGAITNEHI